jgi:hypothetical protein
MECQLKRSYIEINYFGATLPLDMTFSSAHHSPSTVKRKAKEFVIGTARLNSSQIQYVLPVNVSQRHGDNLWFTSLPNDEEEPQAS